MSFPKMRLDQVCRITMGQAPSGDSYNFDGNGLALIAGAGDFGKETPEPKKYTTAAGKKSGEGEIILCIRATIGDLNWSDKEYCLGRGVAGLFGHKDQLDQKYLWHWLKNVAPLLKSKGKGATFLQVIKEDICSLEITLPPLAEQRRIASILDQADDLRQKRQQAIEKLDQLLQATFIDMFGDPVSNPKAWKIDSLNNYGAYKNGLNFGKGESGNQVLYIGVGDFKQLSKIDDVSALSTLNLNDLPSSDYFIKNGDLLFVRSNGNKELVGRCIAVYPNEKLVTYSGFCIRYRIEQSELTSSYLVHLFKSKSFKQTIFDGGQGANIQNINQQLLSRLQVPIPPKDLQEKWSKIVLNIEDQKLKFDQHLKIQNQLFISLQNQAFSGTL